MDKKDLVIITGAAGGIGQATVEAFLNSGYIVAGIDRYSLDEARSEGIIVGSHAGENNSSYKHFVADVTDAESVDKAVKEASLLGRVRYAINIAGAAHADEVGVSRIEDIPVASVEQALSLNLTG